MAYYPVNERCAGAGAVPEFQEAILARKRNLPIANQAVRALAEEMGVHFINVNDGLTDEEGRTREELCIDGVHMYANACEVIFRNLQKYL